jgi:uncharacterized protein YjbI with pentapeptide repeats
MVVRLSNWLHNNKKLIATFLISASIMVVVIGMILVGYQFDWTGFNGKDKSGKTLYDWLQLLMIPVVLAIGGYLFSLTTSKNEHVTALDNQREAALNEYIDKMAELLLHENLRESKPGAEIRDIARARTLGLLQRLDVSRKGTVLKFLYETSLIKGDNCVIDLSDADLSQVNIYPELLLAKGRPLFRYNLSGINLRCAHLEEACLAVTDLSGTNLSGAILQDANLVGVDLIGANLQRTSLSSAQLERANLNEAVLIEADMFNTDLTGADLTGANLKGAKYITVEELEKQAKSLKGATMPDGSIHE